MRNQLAVLCATFAVTACSPPQAHEPPAEFSVNGLKFGQTFSDAMIAVHPYQFSAASSVECQQKLALRGCTLQADNLNAPFVSADGIPLKLLAKFDQRDRLYYFTLSYLATDATDGECLSVVMRGADWLAQEYGPPIILPADEKDGPVQLQNTPGGHPIGFNHSTLEGHNFWVTARSRVTMEKVRISMLGTYFARANNGDCQFWLSFENPFHEKSDSIE